RPAGPGRAERPARRRAHRGAHRDSRIGPWTVQGALIIALQREDVVLPAGLALRKAIRAAYHLDHLPARQEVLAIAGKWRPHRSLATSYLFSAAFQPSKAPPVARARCSAVTAQLARAASGMLDKSPARGGADASRGADFTDRCRTWASLPLTNHEVIVQT